ncbi:hypothetical protein M2347_001953 [Chryseobacterium sp. H1D6B]|nr:hypothetical protein [Chryseobacterium sp. H1D6B]MDH6252226.1 hypothetical protein [Chryseobacterium sp. H1D6B]
MTPHIIGYNFYSKSVSGNIQTPDSCGFIQNIIPADGSHLQFL